MAEPRQTNPMGRATIRQVILRGVLPVTRSLLLAVAIGWMSTAAAQETTRSFHLVADSAEISLKRFSEQSNRGVLFVTEQVKGWRTEAISGEWTPSEALRRML